MKVTLIVGGIIIVILAGILFFAENPKKKLSQITDFSSCAKVYPVLESYPAICKTPDGRTFTQSLTEEEKKKLIPPQEH